MLAFLRALLQYRTLDAVLNKWPYFGTGMAQISLRIFATESDSSFFFISSEMDVHTYDTHWITGNTKKKINSNIMWRGIIMRKYPYIKLTCGFIRL